MTPSDTIVIVSDLVLASDCLAYYLNNIKKTSTIHKYKLLEEWNISKESSEDSIILIITFNNLKELDNILYKSKLIIKENPSTKIVIISDYDDIENISRAIKIGIKGYIPLNSDFKSFVAAIKIIESGGIYVPTPQLLNIYLSSRRTSVAEIAKRHKITQNELNIIKYLRQGMTNIEIADKLSLKQSTIKVHIKNIMKKLKAKNRTEVAALTNDLFD